MGKMAELNWTEPSWAELSWGPVSQKSTKASQEEDNKWSNNNNNKGEKTTKYNKMIAKLLKQSAIKASERCDTHTLHTPTYYISHTSHILKSYRTHTHTHIVAADLLHYARFSSLSFCLLSFLRLYLNYFLLISLWFATNWKLIQFVLS